MNLVAMLSKFLAMPADRVERLTVKEVRWHIAQAGVYSSGALVSKSFAAAQSTASAKAVEPTVDTIAAGVVETLQRPSMRVAIISAVSAGVLARCHEVRLRARKMVSSR
jgi:citrate lyase alpha subunit